MPRKKHAFINRARARTYQVVHRNGTDGNDGDVDAFVPVNELNHLEGGRISNPTENSENVTGNEYNASGEVDISEFASTYSKIDYELGEYGFPDDGYDYSKHFKTIGGGGGVFMDALTGLPNPDAVRKPLKHNEVKNPGDTGGVMLKDEFDNEPEEESRVQYASQADLELNQEAIEAIRRERKRNKDLDEVFAALDSDGELDSSNTDDETRTDDNDDEVDILALLRDAGDVQSDILEDDFVAQAEAGDGLEDETELQQLDGIVEGFREPRLLDEQFERFMRGYELDVTDSDDDGFPGEDVEDVEEELNIEIDATTGDLDQLWQDEALLGGLSGLSLSGQNEEDDALEAEAESESNLAAKVSEYEEIANAEFERGMKGLLDSYKRVPAEEALGAIHGVDMALEALKRAEEEEKERLERLDGTESDGHDSELDRQFDEMFMEPEEKWDCETILTTYSNLENHPSVIDAPASTKRRPTSKQAIVRLDPRTQMPVDYMPNVHEVSSREDFGSRREANNDTGQGRDKDESREEKKMRKAAAKEAARERRMLKKEMKKAFGTERAKQNQHATSMGNSKVAMQF